MYRLLIDDLDGTIRSATAPVDDEDADDAENEETLSEEEIKELRRQLRAARRDIEVRYLGYRWGSCGRKDILYFHWATILLPPRIVEYVAVHELVHLIEPNHTPEFWLRPELAMPDYKQRKQWLAQHGGEYVAL